MPRRAPRRQGPAPAVPNLPYGRCGKPEDWRRDAKGKLKPVAPCKNPATVYVGWVWRCAAHGQPRPPDPSCTHSLAHPNPTTGALTCSFCCGELA